MARRALWRALDVVWLLLLGAYVAAGYDAAPFHGDEATLIAMSGDYHPLVQRRDPQALYYSATPDDPAAQELRIINGTVGKMAMGLAWDLAGFTVDDLNEQWIWGFHDPSGEWDEWSYNTTFGHMPAPDLLRAARLSSTLLLIGSAWLVFAIAWRAGEGRAAAWAGSLIYVTSSAVLLNGRRAMMEGSMLCFSALAVLAAVELACAQADPAASGRRRAGWAVGLGMASGLAVASKHSALMIVVAAFIGAALGPAVYARGEKAAGLAWRRLFDARHIGRLALPAVLVVVVFLALNPAWWPDPLGMPAPVLEARRALLDRQVSYYGGYEGLNARLAGLLRQTLYAEPQYFEVSIWQEWVGGAIDAYDGAWHAGRGGGPLWGLLLGAALIAGAVRLLRRWRSPAAWIALVWLVFTALALVVLTPLEWQRYYLPLQAPLAVVAGVGVAWAGRAIVDAAGWRVGRYVSDPSV